MTASEPTSSDVDMTGDTGAAGGVEGGPREARVRELRVSARRIVAVYAVLAAALIATDWSVFSAVQQVTVLVLACVAVAFGVVAGRFVTWLARRDTGAGTLRRTSRWMLVALLVTQPPVLLFATLAAALS